MKRIIMAALAVGLLAGGAPALEGGRRERMKERIKEKLELTDEQSDKLEKIHKEHRASMETLRDKSIDARRKLKRLVRDEVSEKEIQAALDSADAAAQAHAEEMRKLQKSLASVLKPSQRAKLRLAMGKMMKRGAWRRHRKARAMLE